MRVLVLLPVLLLPGPPVFCQTGGSIEGRVVSSATQAAIGDVAVTVRRLAPWNQNIYHATTDTTGAFRITGVAEADYAVEFSKTGFGERVHPALRKPLHVANGETARISVELVPLGVLRGRVVDGDRRPVPKARIELARIRGGSAEVATTNGDGQFEISESGTFTLMARPADALKPPKPPAENERTVWAPTYYPRGILRSEAARIVLRPGEELDGYEIRLRDVPVYRIRGVAVGEDEKPLTGVRVRLIAPDQWNGASEAQAVSGQDGVFEFTSAWARDWELAAQMKRGDTVLKGFGSTVVSNHNADGVVLRLAPPFVLHGIVTAKRSSCGRLRSRSSTTSILIAPPAAQAAASSSPVSARAITTPAHSPGWVTRISCKIFRSPARCNSARPG